MTRILIIRLSAMGDVAMTVPVIENLQRAYPDVRITVLTNPFFRPFFRDIPGMEFVETDFKNRHKGIKGIIRLHKDIRRVYKIDMIADLHDVIRTKILRKIFRLNGIKIAIIDKERKHKKELTRPKNKIFRQLTTTPQRYADVFRKLGFKISDPVPAKKKSCPVPAMILEKVGIKSGKWLGIAPFAQHTGKIYPVEQMAKVAEILSAKENIRLFIFGGGEPEKQVAEDFQRRFPDTLSVIGKLSLSEELDLISNLDCMVSMDSSAMHMASLSATPTVSVWGATHYYTGFLGLGQSIDDIVESDLPCRPCSIYGNVSCHRGDYACMRTITPEMIAGKVLKVIGE